MVPIAYPVDPHAHCHLQSMMECYKISGEPEDNDELWNINILKIEGSKAGTTLDIPTNPMSHPLRIRKVNIGMEENPKFASVGDYWDEETMENIMDLLHEFQDLFLTKFS